MPSNYTSNYQLNQWEADDRVLRTDFNADNAKIEAALSSLEERVAMLCRAVPNLAYYTGLFGLTDFAKRGKVLPSQSMTYDDFRYSEYTSLTGGVKIVNGVLTLEGAGATGVYTGYNISIDNDKWTRAMMWVHYLQLGTDITPSINGVPMKREGFRSARSPGQSKECFEKQFSLEGGGSSSAQISLALDCGTSNKLEVYDYCVFFF